MTAHSEFSVSPGLVPPVPRAALAEGPRLLDRWRLRGRARRYYAWGRAVELSSRHHSGPKRASRLYQRGLRAIEPAFPAGVPVQGLASRTRLEWALAVSAPWHPVLTWSRGRWTVIAGLLLAAMGVAAGTVGLALWLGAPRNLAINHPWRASSADSGLPAEGRISDVVVPTAFMHTLDEDNPWMIVDLESTQQIGGFQIDNRKDCCADRTVPLTVEVSTDGNAWTLVARRTAGFSSWVRHFRSRSARYVRVRLERHNYLHLARVRVFR